MTDDYVNLITIRHKLEPKPKPTAMEEWQRNDLKARRMDAWLMGLGIALAIILGWLTHLGMK